MKKIYWLAVLPYLAFLPLMAVVKQDRTIRLRISAHFLLAHLLGLRRLGHHVYDLSL